MKIQITAIKFETVNGKKAGKSISFGLDPREMTKYKTEATLRKNIAEYVGGLGVFKKEELSELKYDMGEFLAEWKKQLKVVKAEERKKTD